MFRSRTRLVRRSAKRGGGSFARACAVSSLLALACASFIIGAPRLDAAAPQGQAGILLLAHGGNETWNENVRALAKRLDAQQPVEVAFGMATRANIKRAMDALTARGVARIVAVPLFVSSHSSVVTSTEYLLGVRQDMPPDLVKFAKMSHGTNGAHAAGHVHAATSENEDGTRPIKSPVPLRMTGALDSHPIVARILTDRARAISTDPAREAVILVAHGPVRADENAKWLENMKALGEGIGRTVPFASIDWLTVRDDAPPAIRDAATAELRALVTKRRDAGSRVLVVPVLLSFGGIEQGVRKRLEGLDYTMASQAIVPDDRVLEWIKLQAGSE
jgi:sirohydrochlorin ferrochelatase